MQRLFIVIALIAVIISFGCGGGGALPDEADDVNTDGGRDGPADTTPPRITSVGGLDNGWQVAGCVTVEATAVDDNAVATMELRLDGEAVATADAATLVHEWDARALDPGAYVLTFIASDPAGNEGSDSIFVYVIDYEGEDVVIPGTGPAPSDPQPAGPTLLDPGLYLPPTGAPVGDSGDDTPRLILTGIADGDLVYEEWYISAVGSARTGINGIALLVNGRQVAASTEPGLSYHWDTTEEEDGDCWLTFLIRSNSGKIGELVLGVTVDNFNDYSPPVLRVDNSTWEINDLSGQVETYKFYPGCRSAGTTSLVFDAIDKSALRYFRIQISDEPQIETTDAEVTVEFTPDDYRRLRDPLADCVRISLEAMDEFSHFAKREIHLYLMTSARIEGRVWSVDEERINGMPMYLFMGEIHDPANCDPARAIMSCDIRYYHGFEFTDLPFTLYTLYVQYEGMHSCLVVNPGPGYDRPKPWDFQWVPME